MDDLEFYEFLTFFYRSPVPERASEAIRLYTSTSSIEDPLSCVPAAYFFARMAQMYPDLVKEYEDLVPETRTEGKPFILGVLKDLQSTPPGPINVLDRTVRMATDNDLLWAEFILTGSNKPILRLIGLLERPDKVREKLESWLTSPFARHFGTAKRRQRTCENLRTAAGIACDPDLKQIETPGDLDCLCLMQGVDLANSDRVAEIRQALPFDLADEEVADMGVKATAKWSLASNANRHSIVLVTCEEELARRKGNIKAALQEIVEFARLNGEDYAEAMKLRQAADRGDADAQCKLGIMYKNGQGVHRDDRLAAIWLRKAAEQGVTEAEYKLGVMQHYGEGVEEDDTEAERWVRKAAEQGVAEAQNNLGCMYERGQGVPQDYAEAMGWWRKAAEQGHAESLFNLGQMYRTGEGVTQDYTEAAKWFRKAAEQDFAPAQSALGAMYGNGDGMPQDFTEAINWHRRAAEQNDPSAQLNLGQMYFYGQGVPQDDVEAAEWYRRAAQQGASPAQHSLGLMYATGTGVPQDFVEAMNWYRKASEQGLPDAQYNLALLYYEGQGISQDHVAAADWFRSAADQGHAEAQLNLGAMYNRGEGVARDNVQALMWLNLSVQHGDSAAQTISFYFFFDKPIFQWPRGRSEAEKARDIIAKQMAPAEIAEAERLAREWKPKTG